ncbi:MAG: serine/threonine-protein kinase [Polyangiaceae bacterium]
MGASYQPDYSTPVEPCPGMVMSGKYQLLTPVGDGGMAIVWAARTESGQLLAIKMIRPELAEDPMAQQMFLDEARIASQVRHENVCHTLELGQHEGVLYLAMEWVDTSLVRVLRPELRPGVDPDEIARTPIHPRLAARIVADSAMGLHAAHELRSEGVELGVVHRDVSPHNILITADGRVKVSDFGVVKALGKLQKTLTGQIKGKLGYMAPEQLTGGQIDRRSDVFALGVVLFEATTGHKPFVGDSDPQMMSSILLGRMEPATKFIPDYPPELNAIVLRALANEPNDRYASAADMQRALEDYLRRTGPPVPRNAIADIIVERCGEEVAAQMARVKSALDPQRDSRAIPRSRPASAPSGTGMGLALSGGDPRRRGDARPGGSLLPIVVAVLIGTMLGVGVLGYVWNTKRSRSVVAARRATGEPLDLPSAQPVSTAPVLPPTQLQDQRVTFNITPPQAILVVQGIALPKGTNTVQRPRDGSSMDVLIRAAAHEDVIVIVDSATPKTVDVALVPLSKADPNSAIKRKRLIVDAGPSGTAASPATTEDPVTPPNPYD